MNIENIFQKMQEGYKSIDLSEFDNKTIEEMHIFFATLNSKNVFSSEDVAIYAGKLMAFFGIFLKKSNEETKKVAEQLEDDLATNFRTSFKNAIYLSSIGK